MVARNLPISESGVIFVGVSLLAVVSTVGRVGLDQAVVKRISQVDDRTEVSSELSEITLIVAIISLLLALGLWLGIGPIGALLNVGPEFRDTLSLFLLGVAPLSLSLVTVAILNGAGRNISATTLQTLLPQGVSLVAAFAWVLLVQAGFTRNSASAFALMYVLGTPIAAVIGLLLANAAVGFSWTRNRRLATNETLRTGLHLYPGALADIALTMMPTLLVSATAGNSEAALFNVAQRIAALVFFVFAAMNTVAAPQLGAAFKRGNLLSEYKRFTGMMTAVIVPVCLVAALIHAPLLALFGAGYAEARTALLLLLAVQIVHAVCGPAITGLVMADLKRQYNACMIIGVSTSLVLTPLLASEYGATGAALAVLLGVVSQKATAVWYLLRSPIVQRRNA